MKRLTRFEKALYTGYKEACLLYNNNPGDYYAMGHLSALEWVGLEMGYILRAPTCRGLIQHMFCQSATGETVFNEEL